MWHKEASKATLSENIGYYLKINLTATLLTRTVHNYFVIKF